MLRGEICKQKKIHGHFQLVWQFHGSICPRLFATNFQGLDSRTCDPCKANSKIASTTKMTIRPIHYFEADVDMRDVETRSRDERDHTSFSLPAQYKIFLSHSRAQKYFIEQLFLDLKNRGHNPFFDKSSDSLPTGLEFPRLTERKASQCDVAVVVLSDKYLMSKWPMLELLAIVDAQRTSSCNSKPRILPLFFKLDVGDLKDNAAIQRWGPSGRNWRLGMRGLTQRSVSMLCEFWFGIMV